MTENQLVVKMLEGKTLRETKLSKQIVERVCREAAPEIANLFNWKEVQFAKTINGLRGYASYLINAINVMENG